ncbi:MAG: hypothetical protein RLZZ401_1405 [Pseudomonadota bacterium]
MRILFDSSAIYKRYDAERGHARVMQLGQQASEVVAAAHSRTEVTSALNRQRHDGVLSQDDYTRILGIVQREFAEFVRYPLDASVELLANAAMELARLRSADALQLATAQLAQVDLFVTADPRLAKAALAVGLKTELIEA